MVLNATNDVGRKVEIITVFMDAAINEADANSVGVWLADGLGDSPDTCYVLDGASDEQVAAVKALCAAFHVHATEEE